MKLKFSLEYKTAWGESLHVMVTYLSRDGHRRRSELAMDTRDGILWTLETAAMESYRHPAAFITYYYMVVDGNGKLLRREWLGEPRLYPFDIQQDFLFPDYWRDAPLNIRFSRSASQAADEKEREQQEQKAVNNYLQKVELLSRKLSCVLYHQTVLFAVKAPDLHEGEEVAIIGNHPTLGSWLPERFLRMKSVDGDLWMLSVDVTGVEYPLEYKYVIIDRETRLLKIWEEGANRRVHVSRVYPDNVIIEDGYLLRVKDPAKTGIFTLETTNPEYLLWHLPAGTRVRDFAWREEYDTYVFDLDGTLISSLEDLCASCNYALHHFGFPQHSLEEVRMMVGNGVKKLMERATPDGLNNPKFDEVYSLFRKHYMDHNRDHTAPYPGIMDMLRRLRAAGKHVAVVSNKFYAATQALCKDFFGPLVEVAIGERENIRKKPAPDTVVEALRQLGVTKDRAVYIGDSDVDIMTARNSGMPCISVLWGFRDRAFLVRHGATTFVSKPEEIY